MIQEEEEKERQREEGKSFQNLPSSHVPSFPPTPPAVAP
ncbi:hypothetical protein E2C01_093135 [Portunus trituberculatus]|uniref:Uncharacterized protein n=1 Tax=Portunus trituberculatus TaxID=210409 RepID=A0A5B7JLZ7_PORTR|nr:hypothetical protein [Portunus trituberculatus]